MAQGLQHPIGVAVDAFGAIVVSERRGTVTRIAADGDHAVVLSRLDGPAGVAFDRDGALLIVEERGGRVLRYDPLGALTVVASGVVRPRWLAVADEGTLYLTARGVLPRGDDDDDDDDDEGGTAARILRISLAGSMTTVANGLRGLDGLAWFDQTLYAAIRRLTTDRKTSTGARLVRIPVRPDGAAGPVEPLLRGGKNVAGLAVDRLGALVATTRSGAGNGKGGGAVLKRLPTGEIVTLASRLRNPRGMAFEAAGHLLVVEAGKSGRLVRLRAPAPPATDVPAFTNQSLLTVHGQAAPADLVQVFRANDVTSPLAAALADGATGAFTLSTPLALNTATPFTLFATATGGLGLSSAPESHTIIHDDRWPAIAIVEPVAGAHARDIVTLRARGEDDGSGVASMAFMLEDAVVATVDNPDPTEPLVAAAVLNTRSVAEGPHTLTVVATDRAGNAGTAAQLLVVDRTPPDTQIVSGPSRETTETTVTFTVAGSDLLSPSLDFAWRLDAGAWSPFGATTTIVVSDLTPGEHRFEVTARDLAGNEDPTPAVQTFSVIALSVRITEPVAGTVIATDAVWVRGVALGRDVAVKMLLPPELQAEFGLTDVPAAVEAGTFVVKVPVTATTTMLTVTATDAQGRTATDSVAILVQAFPTSQEGRLGISPPVGLAPHIVQFGVLQRTGSSLALDLESDGTLEFDGATLADRSFTYERPGIYVATLRETTPEGVVFTHRTVVEVYDRAALDARLQSAWRGFKETLAAGDVSQAVAFVHSNRRSRWAGAFRQLTPEQLATADTVFTSIELVEIRPGMALCDMRREDDGVMYSFPIEFALDTDGRWRLWQF